MNNYKAFILFFVLLLAIPKAWANQCPVKGNKEFSIEFSVVGSTTTSYLSLSKNDNREDYIIWYTNAKPSGNVYIFSEQSLTFEENYDVLITYDGVNKLKYYRKRSVDSYFTFIEEKTESLPNGDLKGFSESITDLDCAEDELLEPKIGALYEFGVQSCAFGSGLSSSCSIPLTQNYQTSPLVFVMPTIRQDIPDGDAPSRLVITAQNSTSVTIQQRATLLGESQYEPVPMTSISYFVMEPGVNTIEGHEVVAGYVDTDATFARRGDNNSSDKVKFSKFGGTGFATTPIVLHQLQSDMNLGQWMTSGSNTNGVDSLIEVGLYIELSDTGDEDQINREEKVGFLAAEQSSVLNVDGKQIQFGTYTTLRQAGSNSMQDGCDASQSTRRAVTNLSSISGIIGKKQGRGGADGGWLRRCKIEGNEATFSVDEDRDWRAHTNEDVGYLAFGNELPALGSCPYFPEELQSNAYYQSGDSWLPHNSSLAITNGSGSGNRIYLDQIDINENLGFTTYSGPNGSSNSGCVYPNNPNLATACKVSNSKILFPDGPPDTRPFTESGPNIIAPDSGNIDIKAGNYTSFSFGMNRSSITLSGGEYWVGNIDFNHNDVSLLVKDNESVIIHYKSINFNFNASRMYINADGSPSNDANFDYKRVILVGHGNTSQFWLQGGSDIRVNGSVYVDSNNGTGFNVSDVARFQMTGAVSASLVNFNASDDSYIRTKYIESCEVDTNPLPTITTIEVKPFNYHLTCDTAEVQVVLEGNGDLSGYQPTLSVSGSNASDLIITPLTSSNSSGVATYSVSNLMNNVSDYTLNGELTIDNASLTDSATMSYKPFKFDIKDNNKSWGESEQSVVPLTAGKTGDIDVRVLACNDGQTKVANYSKTLTMDNVSIDTAPIGGNGAVDIRGLSFTDGELTSPAQVEFDNSGELIVKLKDAEFDCSSAGIDCPIDGADNILQGLFTLKSRPWKIAVCDVLGESGERLSDPISGFISSGKPFDVTYKPIIYSTGNQECSYPIATNYAEDSGPLSIAKDLVYPDPTITSATVGTINPMTNEPDEFPPGSATIAVTYTWNEVGSLEFTTPPVIYLGATLDQEGSAIIGRFYPDYFNSLSNSWVDPSGQSFTYMNQPFGEVEVVVAAYSALNNEVSNYASFNSNHQALFSLEDDDDRLVNADASSLDAVSSYAGSRWQLNSSVIEWSKQSNLEPDGPFNVDDTVFDGSSELISSIQILESVVGDPVQFLSTNSDTNSSDIQELPDEHPRVVFGRVNLNDVGGVEGSEITVPLQVQYWNGNAFVNNTSDSFTDIDAEMDGSPTVIWPVGTTTSVTLTGTADVSNGVSTHFTAQQDLNSITREQVQMWQELNSSDNYLPWLQFDWDQNGIGEENPSTIVTFGIHRGNDRVIYRGEPGL